MQLHFFNTNDSNPEQVKVHTQKNLTQEDRCYQILIDFGTHLTPFEISQIYNNRFPEVPITSIRRALTCLTKAGKAEKVNITKIGNYGVKNYQWRAIK
jgi:Fe2+ or Zn2+ uptake regulation protein